MKASDFSGRVGEAIRLMLESRRQSQADLASRLDTSSSTMTKNLQRSSFTSRKLDEMMQAMNPPGSWVELVIAVHRAAGEDPSLRDKQMLAEWAGLASTHVDRAKLIQAGQLILEAASDLETDNGALLRQAAQAMLEAVSGPSSASVS